MGGGGGMGMMGGGGMSQQHGGMKPGDWLCPGCGDHQFSRNETCRKCGHAKPAGVGAGMMAVGGGGGGAGGLMAGSMKPGDWICAGCGDHQFAKNETCRKCGHPRPEGAGGGAGGMMAGGMKPGDWMCPGCEDHQFARNEVCRKCGQARPEGAPGLKGAGHPGAGGKGCAIRSTPY